MDKLDEITQDLKELRKELRDYKLAQEHEKSSNLKGGLIFVGSLLLAVISFVIHEFVMWRG